MQTTMTNLGASAGAALAGPALLVVVALFFAQRIPTKQPGRAER